MAITPNSTFSVGAVLTAQQQNNFPRGVMGAVQSTSGNFTVTTAFQDVTGMSVTFTAVAGRTYKFNVQASALKNTSESFIYLAVTNAADGVVAGAYASAAPGEYANLSFSNFITGVSAGSITFKLRTITGAATATLIRSGSDYLSFWIEDIGTA